MFALVLSLCAAIAASLPQPHAVRVPLAKTAATDLSLEGIEHHEVLRIGRDFGKSNYQIVVDSWISGLAAASIAEVRMWWVNTARADQRSPFGRKVQRYVDIEYQRQDDDTWRVVLRADRKEFDFDVELGPRGEAHAYADIVDDHGATVSHCRAERSRLVARRFVGFPVGIKRLEVTCIDDAGQRRRGHIPYQKLRRGPVYQR